MGTSPTRAPATSQVRSGLSSSTTINSWETPGPVEERMEAPDEVGDVACLVEGGDDEAEVDVAVVVASDLQCLAVDDVDDSATGHGLSCAGSVGVGATVSERP